MTRHVIQWRRLRWTAALVTAIVTSAAPAATTAHHQLIPANGLNAIGDCQGTDASPCIRWRKSGGTSITIQLYLDDSLDLGYIDLTADVQNARTGYNAIAALNPLVEVTSDPALDEMTIDAADFNDYQILAGTSFSPWPMNNTSNRINHTRTTFNTEVSWTRQISGWCDNYGAHLCYADARKVANHEFGHSEGLGHEDRSIVTAVMVQGFVSWYAIKQDDKDGIIDIYGAAP